MWWTQAAMFVIIGREYEYSFVADYVIALWWFMSFNIFYFMMKGLIKGE